MLGIISIILIWLLAEKYFSDIIGEEIRWLSNTWGGSHINVQANEGLDTKIFDWHVDSQPLTLIINVSDMPEHVIGGSTILRKYDDGSEIELKQPAKGYATLFRGTGKYLYLVHFSEILLFRIWKLTWLFYFSFRAP